MFPAKTCVVFEAQAEEPAAPRHRGRLRRLGPDAAPLSPALEEARVEREDGHDDVADARPEEVDGAAEEGCDAHAQVAKILPVGRAAGSRIRCEDRQGGLADAVDRREDRLGKGELHDGAKGGSNHADDEAQDDPDKSDHEEELRATR